MAPLWFACSLVTVSFAQGRLLDLGGRGSRRTRWMPSLRRVNCSRGSKTGLWAATYLMRRDHLLRVRLSALAGSASASLFSILGVAFQELPTTRTFQQAPSPKGAIPYSTTVNGGTDDRWTHRSTDNARQRRRK
jgi:hypothetical protein